MCSTAVLWYIHVHVYVYHFLQKFLSSEQSNTLIGWMGLVVVGLHYTAMDKVHVHVQFVFLCTCTCMCIHVPIWILLSMISNVFKPLPDK